ncbi:tyrosine-type recombinase/integrase [Marinicella rhabdoformis]|uniref:tyrosine-type recombinase/integrase n=1 Tax=Marinicella rhabdoformis TaxID=2580566 RepID=UPI0015CF8903|nr:integrase arm-type DNA-binding domain-containing protein [Marinicella rhabdoformis]
MVYRKCTTTMKLNISTINALKHEKKQYKVFDGGGLFLLVHPNGSKYWRLNYRYQGKQKTIALGVFGKGADHITLAKARQLAQEVKKLLAEGKDPSEEKKEQTAKTKGTNSFETIARQWIDSKSEQWTERHTKAVLKTLEQNIFPYIGTDPINTITSQKLLATLRRIEKRGSLEMLKKIRQRCNGIFVFAKISGLIESNPAEGISQVLKTHKANNHRSINLSELPELVNAINTFTLEPTTKTGLLIALYTFQRTNEIRFAQWHEFDFEAGKWSIPAARMKMKRDHVVPLSKQAIEALKSLQPITGHYPFVFASTHKPNTQPFSENAMLFALYRMGFNGRHTVHGCRHLASTTLNEMGFDSRWIEKQLSHEDKNTIRGTYNKAEYMPERTKMMQQWADFVDQADGSNIVPIGHKKTKQSADSNANTTM